MSTSFDWAEKIENHSIMTCKCEIFQRMCFVLPIVDNTLEPTTRSSDAVKSTINESDAGEGILWNIYERCISEVKMKKKI